MTAITDGRITAEAASVKFLPFIGGVLRAILLNIFGLLGWLVGSLWFGIVYCCLAVKYGFMQGAHMPIPKAKQPSIPQ